MYVDPRFGANSFILFNLGGKRLNQIHQSGQQYFKTLNDSSTIYAF